MEIKPDNWVKPDNCIHPDINCLECEYYSENSIFKFKFNYCILSGLKEEEADKK